LAADVQHFLSDGQQRQILPGGGCLEHADLQLAVVALDLLADPDFAVCLINVTPAEREHFTAA
jgi:hypothetical protein